MKTARVFLAVILAAAGVVSAAHAREAAEIVKASGVKGGLVVHLGCGDGRLTADLRVNDSYVVHGLDVLEQEPTPVDNPLLDMPNVIVTPHTAWKAIESVIAGNEFAMENVSRLARGEEPISIVGPD